MYYCFSENIPISGHTRCLQRTNFCNLTCRTFIQMYFLCGTFKKKCLLLFFLNLVILHKFVFSAVLIYIIRTQITVLANILRAVTSPTSTDTDFYEKIYFVWFLLWFLQRNRKMRLNTSYNIIYQKTSQKLTHNKKKNKETAKNTGIKYFKYFLSYLLI